MMDLSRRCAKWQSPKSSTASVKVVQNKMLGMNGAHQGRPLHDRLLSAIRHGHGELWEVHQHLCMQVHRNLTEMADDWGSCGLASALVHVSPLLQ